MQLEIIKYFFKLFQALYIKAEALYAIGEFETALVFFYRCKRIRSDQIEYQIGINKATEAIESAVGGFNFTHSMKIQSKLVN